MRNKIPPCLCEDKINFIKINAGKINREKLADMINVSVPTLKRACRFLCLSLETQKRYTPDVINDVLCFYKINGMQNTKDNFKEINVRSIVDKYAYKKYLRQKPWQLEEILSVIKLSGLFRVEDFVSFIKKNAGPNAVKKTIYQDMFNLKIKHIRKMNGLSKKEAEIFVNPECPYLKTSYPIFDKLYLYCDMEKHLKDNLEFDLKQFIISCAKIQKWFWQFDNPKVKIIELYNEIKEKINL